MKLTKSDWSGISAILYGLVGMLAMMVLGNIIIEVNVINVFLCFVGIVICLALASMAKDKSMIEAEWEDEGDN
jgi:FtsH-binding integral membrane protein